MRGVPAHPVTCAKCGNQTAAAKDRLCNSCRPKGRPNHRKKFFWTPELERNLVRAYRLARNRTELSRSITHLQRVSGFSRFTIVAHAAALGLSFQVRRQWSDEEIDLMRELLGSTSQAHVARKLGRTYH